MTRLLLSISAALSVSCIAPHDRANVQPIEYRVTIDGTVQTIRAQSCYLDERDAKAWFKEPTYCVVCYEPYFKGCGQSASIGESE